MRAVAAGAIRSDQRAMRIGFCGGGLRQYAGLPCHENSHDGCNRDRVKKMLHGPQFLLNDKGIGISRSALALAE